MKKYPGTRFLVEKAPSPCIKLYRKVVKSVTSHRREVFPHETTCLSYISSQISFNLQKFSSPVSRDARAPGERKIRTQSHKDKGAWGKCLCAWIVNSPSSCLVAAQSIDAIFINTVTLNTRIPSQHTLRLDLLPAEALLSQQLLWSLNRCFRSRFNEFSVSAICVVLLMDCDWVLDLSFNDTADLLCGWLWSAGHAALIKFMFLLSSFKSLRLRSLDDNSSRLVYDFIRRWSVIYRKPPNDRWLSIWK